MSRTSDSLGEVLAKLARGTALGRGDVGGVLQLITETAATALEVERVNVWLFDPARTAIRCVDCYEATADRHTRGEELRAADFLAYFAALETLRTVAVMDAGADPRTRELAGYLRRHGIATLLDAPIYLEGKVAGVVCHEHAGGPRAWSDAERGFAGSIADTVSLVLETDRCARAESALRTSEALFRAVAEWLPDALVVFETDPKWDRITLHFANPSARRAIDHAPGGPDADLVRAFLDSVHLADRLRAAPPGQDVNFEAPARCADGTVFPADFTARAIQPGARPVVAVVAHDLSRRYHEERQRLDEQAKLLEAQRLKSLGLLAAGVTHDFNNLLTCIQANVGLLRHQLPADGRGPAYLADLELAVERAADLCRQLLAYSGRGSHVVRRLDLSELVGEMVRLLQVSVPKGAELRCELAERPPPVEADATQVRQVVMNLVVNAADALGGAAGTITVRTGVGACDPADPSDPAQDWPPPAGPCVYVEVADTGAGMDEDTRRRMFEPFFSTKAAGRGMGMAAVLGVVRTHRGAIRVTSRPGAGTTIRVLFPAAGGAAG
jgi:signal transduction histidine kinase